MVKLNELASYTESFFKQYCNSALNFPTWNKVWQFEGTIPDGNKRGCYALLKDDSIIYIGVGKSFGAYHGSGLGDRLKRYYKVNKVLNSVKHYQPAEEWKEVTGIVTIGFNEENYFIAAALEVYLIGHLKPIRNKFHRIE